MKLVTAIPKSAAKTHTHTHTHKTKSRKLATRTTRRRPDSPNAAGGGGGGGGERDLSPVRLCQAPRLSFSWTGGAASRARLLLFAARDAGRAGPADWTLESSGGGGDHDDNSDDDDDDDPIPKSALPPGGADVVVANILKGPLVQARPEMRWLSLSKVWGCDGYCC